MPRKKNRPKKQTEQLDEPVVPPSEETESPQLPPPIARRLAIQARKELNTLQPSDLKA